MFPIPELLSVPVFDALGTGAVTYPTVGAVLAWTAIAALMGTVLGLLREGVRMPRVQRTRDRKVVEVRVAPAAGARECCEAA